VKDGVAFLLGSIGLGIVLEIDGNLVVDASWLIKKNINVTNLDTVLKGINLAQQWRIREKSVTDSVMVFS